MPRIGIVNVNTSKSMTETVVAAARTVVAPDTEVEGVTPESGPASVESHVEGHLSAVGVIRAVHRRQNDPDAPRIDAWVLAGYGDQGREALQELVDVPVVDITEAAAVAAMSVGDRYAVVTTLDRTVPMIRDRLVVAGLADRCVSVRGTGLGVLELEKDDDATDRAILELARDALAAGAESVCLGCAGMAGRAPELSRRLGAPVVDGVTAAVGQAESLVRQGLMTSKSGTYAPRPAKSLSGYPDLEIR
ncbi:aspartate/glutamate racemase family protein [Corynebacterium bovis]|uniref:aspartate/glutamate racemase family protein n=1 Tax=Corynebacterium bovis TaxID=36808 RepID=UPI0031387DD8